MVWLGWQNCKDSGKIRLTEELVDYHFKMILMNSFEVSGSVPSMRNILSENKTVAALWHSLGHFRPSGTPLFKHILMKGNLISVYMFLEDNFLNSAQSLDMHISVFPMTMVWTN